MHFPKMQTQPFAGVHKNKFLPMLIVKSLDSKFAGLKVCNFIRKETQT